MANLDKTTFEGKYNSTLTGLFKNNTTKAIISNYLRQLVEDIADSFFNKTDDAENAARPAFADWDASGDTMPVDADAIGSGAAGAIIKGDEVYFTDGGNIGGEDWPAGTIGKALQDSPTLDSHWRLW